MKQSIYPKKQKQKWSSRAMNLNNVDIVEPMHKSVTTLPCFMIDKIEQEW